MKYEYVIGKVKADQGDNYAVPVVCTLMRDDGVTGDAWVMAGVPDYQRSTADAAGTTQGVEDVWLYGDSPPCWCPDAFDASDHDAILDACYRDALEYWHEYQESLRAVQYEIWDDGGHQDTIEAANLTEAIAEATEWMEAGDYTDGNTHSGEFTLRRDGKVVYSGTFRVE